MGFLGDGQFLYLMGALWVINGTLGAIATVVSRELQERNFMFKFCVTSWMVGAGHIMYAFIV